MKGKREKQMEKKMVKQIKGKSKMNKEEMEEMEKYSERIWKRERDFEHYHLDNYNNNSIQHTHAWVLGLVLASFLFYS